MRKTFAFALWAVLGVAILAVVLSSNPRALYASPALDSTYGIPAFFIGLAVGMVVLWAAFYLSFHLHIQVFIGDVVVLVAVLAYRLYSWVRGRAQSIIRTRMAQKLAEKTEEVADTNAQVFRVHPKLLGKDTVVVLGYDKNKSPVSIDLQKDHTLYAGSTGAGKTNLLAALLVQIFSKPVLIRPQVYVLDMKGNTEDELYKFKGLCEYVREIDEALVMLHRINSQMDKRQRDGWDKPVVLFIDEIADLTAGSDDSTYNRDAIRLLTLIARKGRSAGIFLHVFTQHPRYDVLPKHIANNLLRKVCLLVDTKTQAEVIFGFKPEFELPTKAGDFLLREGTRMRRGHVLLKVDGEIDGVLANQEDNFSDKRLRLWKTIAAGKSAGDNATGIQRLVNEHKDDGEFGQVFVKLAYRHLVAAGALQAPTAKGGSYKLAVTFLDGIPLVKKYIADGKWQGEPEAFV